MKKYIKYFAIPVVAITAMTSCTETDAEKDKGSTPVIKYARDCDPAKGDSLIVAASLGAKLAFVGDNLGDVQQVWFNDQKALLNPTMVTSHTIIIDIPNVIPMVVNNTARFITSTGIEVEYPFTITVPAPRINTMKCEYAAPGSLTTLSGAYFADDPNQPLTVVFEGSGEEAEIVSFDQDNITIVVPDGAVEGPISVKTIYGESTTSFNYADTRGMMFDFERDGATGLGLEKRGWKAPKFKNDNNSITGTYIELSNEESTLNKDSWDDEHYCFQHWSGEWSTPISYPERLGERLFDIVDFSDFKNMSLKFEMRIPASNPWQQCAMQIVFSGVDKTSNSGGGTDVFGNTVTEGNMKYLQDDNGKADDSWGRALYRPWTPAKAFDTADEWITVTIPLTDFIYNSVGGKAKKSPSSPSDFANFEIFVWNGGVAGVDCSPIICIDNIRAVKN